MSHTDLRNTIRVVSMEYRSCRPANNTLIETRSIPRGFRWKKEDVIETIKRLVLQVPPYYGTYALRLSFSYYRKKKLVKTKRTKFFYISGKICAKQEASDYFRKINSDVADKINALSGEKVFWVNYEVQPLNTVHNYELLKPAS